MTTYTEWAVACANGHRHYQLTRGVPADAVELAPCPKCGAPVTGAQLPPVNPPKRP